MHKFILITGPPGIGKTTLIKKVADKLVEKGIEISGFYTDEVRQGNQRIGFDVMTFNGESNMLARKNGEMSSYKVGTYYVYPDSFGKLVLPLIDNPSTKVLILDEIGKMELLNKHFKISLKKLFGDNKHVIIATVPLKGGGFFVEELKNDKNSKVLLVNIDNRNHLSEVIVKFATEM